MSRNRLVKHFLMQWNHFETNYGYLTELEFDNMKILYASLKELSQSDVSLLAAKYKVKTTDLEDNNKTYLRDSIVAEQLGLELKDYVKKRKLIEVKLNRFIIKNRYAFGKEIDVPDRLVMT